MSEEINLELLRLINDDLTKHRDYLHRLYTRALVTGAVMISAVLAVGIWFTGERLNTEIIKQLLDDKVNARVDALAKEHVNGLMKDVVRDAKEKANEEAYTKVNETVNKFLERDLLKRVFESVEPALERYLTVNLEIPKNTVIQMDSVDCPEGWQEFVEGQSAMKDARTQSSEENAASQDSASVETTSVEDLFNSAFDSINRSEIYNSNSKINTRDLGDRVPLIQCIKIR